MLKSLHSLLVIAGCSLVLVVAAHDLSAATITLSADRDNTLIETSYAVDTGQPLNSSNFGAVEYMLVGTAGGGDADSRTRPIISFNSNAMPAFDQINSITLRLFNWAAPADLDGSVPFNVEVHAISAANADWVEGNGVVVMNSPTLDSGSNWNQKSEPGNIAWTGGVGLLTPGLSYDTTTLASQSFNAELGEGAAVDFVFTGTTAQLTSLIESWDVTNPGFVLFHTSPTSPAGNRRLFFHTREALDSNLHPQLIIDFEAAVPAPEPSSIALLGLGLLLVAKRRRRQVK